MGGWTRREWIAGAIAGSALAAGRATAQPAAPLTTDIGTLTRVLVHTLSPEDAWSQDRLQSDLLPSADTDVAAGARQHAALIALLKEAGTEVVELTAALDAAIAHTRPSGLFEAWLRASFPRLASDPARVTPAMLLGRDPAVRFRLGPDGQWDHLADGTESTMWTRDSAVMTPKGLLICRAVSPRRRRENMLLRFAYRHSPLLRDTAIVFDAVEEGINVEGGDMMIVSPDLMLLGVGNRTDPRIAPILARRLDMDVVTVTTVKRDFLASKPILDFGPLPELRILLLHLDTYFTMVGPSHGLAVPFLLEAAHAEDNPFSRFLRGARVATALAESDAEGALKLLKEFGKVARYARGTGKLDPMGDLKLVDWLRQERWRLTFVGGPRPTTDQSAFRHFMEVVHPELRRQAANVVQARPGRVIAYAGNPATKAALEADGIGVDTFEARELWAWHGGPHCLTQPLLRG
jgi:arginine deiminase